MLTEVEYSYLLTAETGALTTDPMARPELQRNDRRRIAKYVKRGWLQKEGETWRLTDAGRLALNTEIARRAAQGNVSFTDEEGWGR